MTNKTINGVPRELLQNLLHCGDTASTITPYVTARVRELLAAPDPIVEADGIGEPVYLVRTHGSCCWEDVSGESLELCQADKEEYEVIQLYSADQLAALQSTIAQLKAEIERLRGEHGDPVAWRVTGRGNVTITPQYPDWAVGDGAEGLVVQALYPCLDEVRRMNP